MQITTAPASNEEVLPLRVRYRAEANGQMTKDSIHQRAGWTNSFLLLINGFVSGFGTIAIAGPWRDKPTVIEFYILPEKRGHAFALFEAFLTASAPQFFEVQSSDTLLTVMLYTYGREIVSESIVFRDELTTSLPGHGAKLERANSLEESKRCFELRRGGSDWQLQLEGRVVGTGGILFHYNHPYGDIHMEIVEAYRGRGLGSYFVQELKRIAYEMGSIPAARCNVGNVSSRKTLQKAGFVPFAHILAGKIATASI
jgi:GNAT superfamily N-acetyltransferase